MEHKKAIAVEKRAIAVEKKAIAVEIALQTQVLKTCPLHNAVFCDDAVDPSSAFALAVDLVKQHTPYVDKFEGDAHELTDLLSATIGDAPCRCPVCASATREQHSGPDQNSSPSGGQGRQELANAAASVRVFCRVGMS